MKGLIISGGAILGALLGMWPAGLMKPKPAWWRWLASITFVATCLLALGVPTGGDFESAKQTTMARGDVAPVPLYGTIRAIDPNGTITLEDAYGAKESIDSCRAIVAEHGLTVGAMVIVDASFSRQQRRYIARDHVATNPPLTLPLIPGLEERARNIYFHVPSAWLAQVAWFVAFCYAVASLRRRRPEDDIRATSAAALGALFCVLATVTGSIWARFNWGEFWNWDPRQVAIFVVLVIFGAYFALRSAIQNEDQRARLSAVYLILMLLPVAFFLFVFPRITNGLHPGSLDSGNAGPILSSRPDALNPTKTVLFGLSFFSFQLIFFWMLNLAVRVQMVLLSRRRAAIAAEPTAAGVVRPITPDVIRP